MTEQPARRLPRVRLAVPVALLLATSHSIQPGPVAGIGASTGSVAGSVRASPLLVTLGLSAGTAPVGRTIRAEAVVTNMGPAPLRALTVELRADRTGLAIRAPIVQVAQLKPGRSTTISWSVCGRAAGSYVLLAHVTAGGDSIDSAARLLEVVPSTRKGSCP